MDVTDNNTDCKMQKKYHKNNNFSLKYLRLSLKYRPEILKLILKMRQCIKRKNILIITLKHRLKLKKNTDIETTALTTQCDNTSTNEGTILNNIDDNKEHASQNLNKDVQDKSSVYCQTIDINNEQDKIITNNQVYVDIKNSNSNKNKLSNVSTQTDEELISKTVSKESIFDKGNKKDTAWSLNKEDGSEEKSIAEQVKEVAQSALQQSGMVYVESAGMYYDYKTGYYYNSELGLYYHTDTGCYYYYSDEKQSFVFHSYPDQSSLAASASLEAHKKKKAKKIKRAWNTEDDIDNLTKNLSQDHEEDSSDQANKPKRKKKSNKKKDIESKLSDNEYKVQDTITSNNERNNDEMETTPSENKVSSETENVCEVDNDLKEELEDGECSETGSECTNSEDDSHASTSTASDDESVAKHYPPCMRVIVRETNLPKLKVGSLFLVTKDGGTVGREGEQHTILIKDHNVSRNHLDIRYDINRKVYLVKDLGSKNGTIFNGIRMSETQAESEAMEVVHGSTIQLGETKLLCHIHPGNDTCGHCEPGLVMETQEKDKKVAYTRTCSVQKQHQLELARLKNKYAPKPLSIEATAYNDRAKERRDKIGSSHHAEKTQSSDLDTFIAPENKGFKLLEKMGWSKGEGLGKDNQGDTEPIPIINNEGKAGLGAAGSTITPVSHPTSATNTLGPATLRLATRTKMLKPPAKAFQDNQDEHSE